MRSNENALRALTIVLSLLRIWYRSPPPPPILKSRRYNNDFWKRGWETSITNNSASHWLVVLKFEMLHGGAIWVLEGLQVQGAKANIMVGFTTEVGRTTVFSVSYSCACPFPSSAKSYCHQSSIYLPRTHTTQRARTNSIWRVRQGWSTALTVALEKKWNKKASEKQTSNSQYQYAKSYVKLRKSLPFSLSNSKYTKCTYLYVKFQEITGTWLSDQLLGTVPRDALLNSY